MKEQEAKEHLEARLECMTREMAVGFDERCDKNCDECDLLYAQGTIGEIKETYKMGIKALEKQIAKKPKKQTWKLLLDNGWEYECPSCEAAIGVNKKDTLDLTQHETYCPECGQKLDWGNEDAE